MPAQTPNANSIEPLVNIAAQQLLSGTANSEPQDSVLFTGVWHDAYPAILVRDPILPDSAKIQMLYLMQEARAQPYGVTTLPSVEATARDLGKSVPTVVRDRAILRMTRWISQCSKVRDTQGRFRGVVYALHGEPASLANATALDPEHMELLEKAAAGHFDRIARRVAHAVLAAIDADIHEGRDPLEPVDQIEQRMEAIKSAKAGNGRFFAGVIPERKSRLKDFKSVEPTSNLETSCSEPVSKFETGGFEPTSRIEVGPETGSGQEKSRKTHSIFSPEYPKKAKNPPKLETGSPCSSSSSSSDLCKKTTTTANQRTDGGSTSLHWPPDFSNNLKWLVLRVLKNRLPDRPQDHQDVVNALAQRLRNKSDPVRNIVGYTAKLCVKVKSGEFCPVQPPSPPAAAPPADSAVHINNLRSEIHAIERLMQATSLTGAGHAALEAQLAQRRSQLRELEKPTRH